MVLVDSFHDFLSLWSLFSLFYFLWGMSTSLHRRTWLKLKMRPNLVWVMTWIDSKAYLCAVLSTLQVSTWADMANVAFVVPPAWSARALRERTAPAAPQRGERPPSTPTVTSLIVCGNEHRALLMTHNREVSMFPCSVAFPFFCAGPLY